MFPIKIPKWLLGAVWLRGREEEEEEKPFFHEWMWQELSVLPGDPATTTEPTNKVSRRPF